MPIPHLRDLHPVAQRTVKNVEEGLTNGNAAFYLGSGIDQQLAIDAGLISTGATWQNLLVQLDPFYPGKAEEILEYVAEWPTETALAARVRLGDEEFKRKIASCADSSLDLNLKKPFTSALGKLLLRSNLIVTSNYSSHILHLLQESISKAKLSKEVIVVSREDLASFQFPDGESDPDRIFVVYIHGRCVGGSSLIFDAWGYNIAINDDRHYYRFLYDLFSRRTVVCIGSSLQDPPLRNQAALVFRTLTYQRPSHISLAYSHQYESPDQYERDLRSNGVKRKWSNAMHAGYGIRVVPLNKTALAEVLSRLSLPETPAIPRAQDLKTVADFFDSCGDYESPVLQEWLLRAPSRSVPLGPGDHIQSLVQELYKQLLKRAAREDFWQVAARLESHLRHFHYLYISRRSPRDTTHRQLWQHLAKALNAKIWGKIDKGLRFRFLTGQFELQRVRIPKSLKGFRTEDDLYDARLALGEQIWSLEDSRAGADAAEKTASKLLDLGWESIASKLFLDAAVIKARRAGEYPDPAISREIIALARRGGEIARATGYFRREAKAETICAMWFEDPAESRIRILSKLRAAETKRTAGNRNRLQRRTVIEPAMVAGLTAGLLASHVRTLRLSGSADLDTQLKESVKPLLMEAGVDWKTVPKQFLPYWKKLIEPSPGTRLAFSEALNGQYIV